MDFSSIVGAVDFDGVSVALMALAALVMLVLVVRWGVFKALDLVDGRGDEYDPDGFDPYDGYTAADDARDRAAAGLGPNPHWDESARLHK